MQSSKKALDQFLDKNPRWILFFLNFVWDFLKLVFNASKKIKTLYDASFKSVEKVSKKKKNKTLFQQKVKENHLDEFLDEFLDEILDEFFFF